MSSMDWKYIAGFFDGEGCLHAIGSFKAGTAGFRVTISQTQEEVLQEIAEFLNQNGIAAYVLRHKVNPKPDAKRPLKPAWNVWITERNSIRKFIEGVFPYLRVKKQRAEDYRRAVILRPSLVGATTPQTRLRRDVFFRLMDSGKTVAQIAQMYGLHYTTVYDKAKRFGYKVDSITISNQKRAGVTMDKVRELLAKYGGDYRTVAQIIGVPSSNLRTRMIAAGIDPGPLRGRRSAEAIKSALLCSDRIHLGV